MSTNAPKPANRRQLPQGRPGAPGYEIVFPKTPPAASVLSGLFGALKDAFGRGGDAVGDAYASGARVVLDRKEALEDAASERRHRARAEANPTAAADTALKAGN